jgi:hypothetical protein
MGKTTTPKYVMTMDCNGIRASDSCWRGRATEKALRAHLVAYNESLKTGGVNERVGEIFGLWKSTAIHGTIIRNDSTREVVAEVTL